MTQIDNGTIGFKSELLRKSIHFCSLSIPIIYYFISKETALSILIPITVISVIIDFSRYFIKPLNDFIQKIFGFLLREHEVDSTKKNLNGASYVFIAATITIWIFPKIIFITAFAMLIICDIAAALIGRRFGKRKFLAKSFEGTLAFFVFAAIVVLFTPKVEGNMIEYIIGIFGGAVGAIIENISYGWADDNLTIPISIGLTMWGLYYLLLPGINLNKIGTKKLFLLFKKNKKHKSIMKNKITILIVLPLMSFLFQNCSTKQKAKGPEDIIYVVADSLEYLGIESALKETFGKVIHTPQPEELFQISRKSINDLKSLQMYKNLIITAPIKSGSYTSRYINSIIDSTVRNLVLEDSVFVINKHDLWAQDQLVMILSATDLETLNQKIRERRDDLFYYFRDKSNKRLAKGLYNRRFEQKDIEAKLLSKYGWMLYIQADYQLAMEKPEDNFVWLRRGVNTDMERWIFVHWIENSTPEFLNIDSISKERDRLTEKYYRTSDDTAFVISYDEYRMDSEVNFNNKYALMTQGLWKFSDESGGGPYISYTFYDEETRRIYMLDASIFAPKYFKKSIIQQVDVLLHKFKTEKEVDPVMKEEILEELEN